MKGTNSNVDCRHKNCCTAALWWHCCLILLFYPENLDCQCSFIIKIQRYWQSDSQNFNSFCILTLTWTETVHILVSSSSCKLIFLLFFFTQHIKKQKKYTLFYLPKDIHNIKLLFYMSLWPICMLCDLKIFIHFIF